MRIGDLITTLAIQAGIGQITRAHAITTLAAACGYTLRGAELQLRDWQSAQDRYRDQPVPNPSVLA